jgi:hypothetical protein
MPEPRIEMCLGGWWVGCWIYIPREIKLCETFIAAGHAVSARKDNVESVAAAMEGGGEFEGGKAKVHYGGSHHDLVVQLERRWRTSVLANKDIVVVDITTITSIIWILTGKERVGA